MVMSKNQEFKAYSFWDSYHFGNNKD